MLPSSSVDVEGVELLADPEKRAMSEWIGSDDTEVRELVALSIPVVLAGLCDCGFVLGVAVGGASEEVGMSVSVGGVLGLVGASVDMGVGGASFEVGVVVGGVGDTEFSRLSNF